MLRAESGFTNAFFFHKTIYGCNVILKDTNGNTLIDNTNIVSCSTISRNSFLCSVYPTEETTIKITGWQNITDTIRTYLSTMDNEIYIYYKVETLYSTLQPRVCFVNDIEVDYKQQNAILKCVSIQQRKVMTSYSKFALLTCGDSISSIFNSAIDIKNTSLPTSYNVVNDTTTENIWNGTNGEYIQDCAIACGGTFHIYLDDNTNTWKKTIVEMPANPSYINYATFNIYDDIKVYDTNEITTSQVYGYTFGDEIELVDKYASHPYSSFTDNEIIPKNYVATYYRYGNLDADTISTFILGNSTYAQGVFSGNTQSVGTLIVKGKPIIEPQPAPNTNYTYILAHFVAETNSTQKAIIKSNADRYLGLTKNIEFSCRLNPALEPLDFVRINYIGYVMIEEIEINYNGGFSGRIKGKLINEPLKKPLSFGKTLTDNYNYIFKIHNENYKDLHLSIHCSDGDYLFNILADETLNLTYQNAPFLSYSVAEYLDNNLSDEVYCYFYDDDGNYSTNLILLEAQV